MVVCKLCNIKFESTRRLSYHIRLVHKLEPKLYYDMFIKTLEEDICNNPLCDKYVSFISLGCGYLKHCSPKCSTLDPKTQDKLKNSMLQKHGVEHPLQSRTILEKMKKNNIQKYGKENVNQVYEVRKKTEETCLKKYGVKHSCSNKEVKEKIRISINKYGFFNNNRKQAETTCLKRYGVKNVSQLEEIKEKKKETSIKNNGYEHWVGTKEHKERMINGGAAYCNRFIKNPSKPQIELFHLCQTILPYPILNYPCGRYSIDIATPQLSLAIEYDGSYWHQDIEYDKEREKKIVEDGWNILRYVDEIPTEDQLLKDINKALR